MTHNLTETAQDLLARGIPAIQQPTKDTVTSSKAERGWSLDGSKMIPWLSLNTDALQTMAARDWSTIVVRSQQTSDSTADLYLVSDEHGLQGRFNEHVSVAMNWVLHALMGTANDLGNFKFGDPAACVEADSYLMPDFSVVFIGQNGNERSMAIAGECKTFWTLKLNKYPVTTAAARSRISKPLGQIAAYMHHYKLRLGFLSTYAYTIFLKRQSDTTFLVSLPIAYNQVGPSIREIFIHLLQIGTREGFDYQSSLGILEVVDNSNRSGRASLPKDENTAGGKKADKSSTLNPSSSGVYKAAAMPAWTKENKVSTEEIRRTPSSPVQKQTAVKPISDITSAIQGLKIEKPFERRSSDKSLRAGSENIGIQTFSKNTVTILNGKTKKIEVVELEGCVKSHEEYSVWKVVHEGEKRILKFWKSTCDSADIMLDNEILVREVLGECLFIPKLYTSGSIVQGKLADGVFVIMEIIEGEEFSMGKWFKMGDLEKKQLRSAMKKAFNYIRQYGIVHEDPRPSNIIWCKRTGIVGVIDWETWRYDLDYCQNVSVDEDELSIILPE